MALLLLSQRFLPLSWVLELNHGAAASSSVYQARYIESAFHLFTFIYMRCDSSKARRGDFGLQSCN